MAGRPKRRARGGVTATRSGGRAESRPSRGRAKARARATGSGGAQERAGSTRGARRGSRAASRAGSASLGAPGRFQRGAVVPTVVPLGTSVAIRMLSPEDIAQVMTRANNRRRGG